MNEKDLPERYLKNINKNVQLNFTLSYRPLQMIVLTTGRCVRLVIGERTHGARNGESVGRRSERQI